MSLSQQPNWTVVNDIIFSNVLYAKTLPVVAKNMRSFFNAKKYTLDAVSHERLNKSLINNFVTLLHSEQPILYGVLALLSAIGLS